MDNIISAKNWKNVSGTSNDKPNHHDSWKAGCESFTKRQFDKCAVSGCKNDADVGAHIQQRSATVYIAPLCNSCNQNNSSFDLKPSTTLVQASKL